MEAGERPVCLFVVFGGTGDLTRRKLLPALYRLAARGVLEGSHVLAVARSREMNDEEFRRLARDILGAEAHAWCDECVHYRPMDATLAGEIRALEERLQLPGNRVFYLALPPQSFAPVIETICASGLNRSNGWTRLVVEKPFGHDLASARELNARVHACFNESQVYRIDHYLGKETVQNLLVFRFANPIFESLWNRNHIDHVQITVAEEGGVENRGSYYDATGAVRDMVQNHLTQILSLIAMEVPARLDAESVRDEKEKVLRSIAPVDPGDALFGQYAGYRGISGVAPDSHTETFAAIKLDIVNWRWNGVPFYLRTGKKLSRRTSEIVISFRRPPVSIFEPFGPGCDIRSNVLVITIQPNEGFRLKFQVKSPGQPVVLASQELAFRYRDVFAEIPEGYETLLEDILRGEQGLFVRADWIETSWSLYDPLLQARPDIHSYAPGSWGPPAAEGWMAAEGRAWHL